LAPLRTTTFEEREKVKENEDAIIKYHLLFGHPIKVVNPLNLVDKQKTIQHAVTILV
jgi:predicted DNA-binding transcriptional regulator YafY